jgi:hypothetical protein
MRQTIRATLNVLNRVGGSKQKQALERKPEAASKILEARLRS